MVNAEIGIYKSYTEYFALGISDYRMKEISNKDKYCLAFEIRNNLNRRKIKSCFIRPLNLSSNGFLTPSDEDLEGIAIAASLDISKTGLEVKINKEIYIKR